MPQAPGLAVRVRPGQKVHAGVTVVAEYAAHPSGDDA
jgi:hypothetical protein